MDPYVRAVAVDYDGTLTETPRPDEAVLAALARLRASGRAAVLVTGRIMAELRADFPDVDDHFDLVVAENGAVLSRDQTMEDLVEPVDPHLAGSLSHRDVPIRQGRVLLACDARHDEVVLREVTRLELDCQLIRNRGALMVLPAGVSKGTGLLAGLEELGISRHNVVGVGDAENDHSLLAACEVGVAVANAVDALKQHADHVLEPADGAGVQQLLDGDLQLSSAWWQLEVGHDAATGKPVCLPATPGDVLVTGASGSGKSHIAGLLAEQLIHHGYTVLVVDPEGEHGGLAVLPGTLQLGGSGSPLPPPARLVDLFSSRLGSVVLDLSHLPGPARLPYLADVANTVVEQRRMSGIPHWVILEEAHVAVGPEGPCTAMLHAGVTGHCLVTYQPQVLAPAVVDDLDATIIGAGGTVGLDDVVTYLAERSNCPLSAVRRLHADAPDDGALIVDPAGQVRRVVLTSRRTSHVRHSKKYAEAELPHHLRFFLHGGGASRPAVAANVGQLHDHLAECDRGVISFHAGRHDFSRWTRDVLCDLVLADELEVIEADHIRTGDADATRGRLLAAIQLRYLSHT